jgi:DNA-binding transcriptional MerR regulator
MSPSPVPEPDRRTFTIRQLCREFGVTARAVRFYEDKGLLSPGRRGQSRVFDARDRARLRLIVQGKRVGFSLGEIGAMLDLYDRRDDNVQQLAVSLKKFRSQIENLKRQREAVDVAIDNLREGCRWIEERLVEVRPDLLPQAEDYHSVLTARLDEPHAVPARLSNAPKPRS